LLFLLGKQWHQRTIVVSYYLQGGNIVKERSQRIKKNEQYNEIDETAVEYKLKLIAFQDEIYQARKKLADSEKRMGDLKKKLEEYVQNKENQIAEVMLTANMNAQRIEVQARNNIHYIMEEMNEELKRGQKELDLLQAKNQRFKQEFNIPLDQISVLDNVSDPGKSNSRDLGDAKPGKVVNLPSSDRLEAIKTEEAAPPIVNQENAGAAVGDTPESIVNIKEDSKSDKDLADITRNDNTPPENKRVRKFKRRKTEPEMDKVSAVNNGLAQSSQQATPEKPALNNPPLETVPKANRENDENHSEPNERMRLDAFVDARYFVNVSGQKQMQNHALQVIVDIEVPSNNYSVSYTKVSSNVVSNMMRYDSVTLNNVFPFDIIEPNLQNIAGYFYNYLEETLTIMDLNLKAITLVELPDLRIKINSRNADIDNLLYHSNDELASIRDALAVNPEPDEDAGIKGKLNRMLKRG
jgi:hypothetical protein